MLTAAPMGNPWEATVFNGVMSADGGNMARRWYYGNLGWLLLAIYLIVAGLNYLGLGFPGVILGLLALAAGILILLGR